MPKVVFFTGWRQRRSRQIQIEDETEEGADAHIQCRPSSIAWVFIILVSLYFPFCASPSLKLLVATKSDGWNNMKAAPKQRYAIGSVVDRVAADLFGVYSRRAQIQRYNMSDTVEHFCIATQRIPPQIVSLLEEWLGADNVFRADTSVINDKLKGKLWRATFNKLLMFNMTQYDKVIVLDNDVLIRQNIEHWFTDFQTPAAVQAKDEFAHNSGAMVITPNTTIFEEMLQILPTVQLYAVGGNDTTNGGYGDQDFLSAYFTRKHLTRDERFHTMPIENAVLISSLDNAKNDYYLRHRRHLFETIHFTIPKPYSGKAYAPTEHYCVFFWEWNRSLAGYEQYVPNGMPLHPLNYLGRCHPGTSYEMIDAMWRNNELPLA